MSSVLESVDARTNLAGENRLEILLFSLAGSKQLYGINVFKIREVIKQLPLTIIPQQHKSVKGVSNVRGKTLSIIDLQTAIGYGSPDEKEDSCVIVSEYNGTVQGFMVNLVHRIVNISWTDIHQPPPGTGKDNYLTAIAKVDDDMVEIIDVEKILAEISPTRIVINQENQEKIAMTSSLKLKKVLIADDSKVARRQLTEVLTKLNLEVVQTKNGLEALQYLEELVKDEKSVQEKLLMLISDVEMPQMDGYKLTAEIRKNPLLKDLYVVLHTSLSGVFNEQLIQKVGADKFVAKFSADKLANEVFEIIDEVKSKFQIT